MGEFAAKFRPEVDLDEFERRLRAAAPAAQQRPDGSDPLAELARLVGGESMAKREDPFEALFRAQSAIAELHNGARVDPQIPEPAAGEAPQQAAHYALREPYFEQQPQAGSQQTAYSYQNEAFAAEPLPYQEAEPSWAPETQASAESGQDWPAAFGEASAAPSMPVFRRKVMMGMATVLALGCVAIGGTLAMRGKSAGQDVVTIQADADPAKVKPPRGEDSSAPAGQALFDRKGGDVSKVVANSEQPADLGVTVKNARVVGAAAGVATPTPPSPSGAAPAAPPSAASAPQADSVFPAPKKVKTISVRADGSVAEGDARPQLARTLPSMAAAAPPPAAAPAAPTPARTPAAKATDRATTTEAALKTPAHPRPTSAPAADAPKNAAAGETGGFAVQLSGTPVESEARAAANSLSAKYSSALQGHKATFVQAKVGDKTIYRVRVSHLTEDSAKSICSAIKAQGGSCFVAKN